MGVLNAAQGSAGEVAEYAWEPPTVGAAFGRAGSKNERRTSVGLTDTGVTTQPVIRLF